MRKLILAALAAMALAAPAAALAEPADDFSEGCKIIQGDTAAAMHSLGGRGDSTRAAWCQGRQTLLTSIFGNIEATTASIKGIGVSQKYSYSNLCMSMAAFTDTLTDDEALKYLALLGAAANYTNEDRSTGRDLSYENMFQYSENMTRYKLRFNDEMMMYLVTGRLEGIHAHEDPRLLSLFGALLSNDIRKARQIVNAIPNRIIYKDVLPLCRVMTKFQDGKAAPTPAAEEPTKVAKKSKNGAKK